MARGLTNVRHAQHEVAASKRYGGRCNFHVLQWDKAKKRLLAM
jgi:hypothetical protein